MSANTFDYIFEDTYSHREKNTELYFGLSIIVHTLIVVASFYITIPVIQKNDPITIEIIEPKNIINQTLATKSSASTFSQTSSAESTLNQSNNSITQSQTIEHIDDSMTLPTKKDLTQNQKISTQTKKNNLPHKLSSSKQNLSHKLKSLNSSAKSKAVHKVSKGTPVPATLDDISAPELDFDSVEVQHAGQFNAPELEQDFKKIDRQQQNKIFAEKNTLNSNTQKLLNENDNDIETLEQKIKNDALSMQNKIDVQKNKNNLAYQNALKQEQDAAKKAALRNSSLNSGANTSRGEVSNPAGTNSNAVGANSLNSNNINGHGQLATSGNTSSSSNNSNSNSGTGVRKVEDLKQVPGNPKPNYSADERLRREQGKVTFQAFVTSDGRLTQFKLLESTGFKNLDGKSLASLKRWKFYPGQQGWVEVSQVWSLTGQIEEMPVLLRRTK